MVVEAAIPQLSTVLLTAAIDSINPCAIGVLILLISTLVATRRSRGMMLKMGLLYIFALYMTYLLAGIGLTYAFTTIPLVLTEYISIFVAVIIAIAGLIEIKDYFWYGRGFSLAIPPSMTKRIHEYTKRITLPGVIFMGAFVAAVELPCTGGPYLAIILLLSQSFDFTAVLLLILYNLIFVLPLVVILFAVFYGAKIHNVKKWKHKHRGSMRLAIGVLLIFLSWLLILIANLTINFI